MVAAGLGVALVPALVLSAFQRPQVAVRALVHAPTWEVSAVVLADGPSPAAVAMLDALQAAARDVPSPAATQSLEGVAG
jgi:DNA-binding transcriptional LysR family regulator